MSPRDFVDMLADYQMPDVFNPYSDVCPIYDRSNAAVCRKANLERYIIAAKAASELSIWIGRDLGHRGGRRTGIALTDEAHLHMISRLYNTGANLEKATHGPVMSERTATVFWEMIGRLKTAVFTWNVFPFHPHEHSKPFSNRCHTKAERFKTQLILTELIKILEPTRIIAIGNDAASGLADLGLDCIKVRHPSYGGVKDFRSGVALTHSLVEPNQGVPLLSLM